MVQMTEVILFIVLMAVFYTLLFLRYVDHIEELYQEEKIESERELVRRGIEMPKILRCQSTKGPFDILLNPIESPNSISEITNMVKAGFFKDIAIFRVNRYIIQFGIRDKSFKYGSNWQRDENPLPKDSRSPWDRGVFSMIGGTQMLIVKKSNPYMGLNNHDTVAGTLSEDDMAVIDNFYAYNDVIDNPTGDLGPAQIDIFEKGWAYLNENFPLIDKILSCSLIYS